MNADVLAAGKDFASQLRRLTDTASEWVADLGPDPWPGRRDEAMIHHSRLQRALQEARTEAAELTVILAQDTVP